METPSSSKKVAAIYDLRAAAEAKAKAQVAVEHDSTPNSRDALLEAQIELENKTADAVEACHDCDDTSHDHRQAGSARTSRGGAPEGGAPAPRERSSDRSNVIDVDFGNGAKSA